MDDADRADIDAPPRRRRAIAIVLALLLPLSVVVVVAWRATQAPAALPAPVVAEVVAPVVATPVVEAPTPLPAVAVVEPARPVVARRPRAAVVEAGTRIATTVVIAEVVGGDDGVRKALRRSFAGAVARLAVRNRADTGYSVTVHVDEQKQRGDEVTVRCKASVTLLPKRNVLASLKARADVEGSGMPVDELFSDAAEACGQALGKDLTAWVKAHPL